MMRAEKSTKLDNVTARMRELSEMAERLVDNGQQDLCHDWETLKPLKLPLEQKEHPTLLKLVLDMGRKGDVPAPANDDNVLVNPNQTVVGTQTDRVRSQSMSEESEDSEEEIPSLEELPSTSTRLVSPKVSTKGRPATIKSKPTLMERIEARRAIRRKMIPPPPPVTDESPERLTISPRRKVSPATKKVRCVETDEPQSPIFQPMNLLRAEAEMEHKKAVRQHQKALRRAAKIRGEFVYIP